MKRTRVIHTKAHDDVMSVLFPIIIITNTCEREKKQTVNTAIERVSHRMPAILAIVRWQVEEYIIQQ